MKTWLKFNKIHVIIFIIILGAILGFIDFNIMLLSILLLYSFFHYSEMFDSELKTDRELHITKLLIVIIFLIIISYQQIVFKNNIENILQKNCYKYGINSDKFNICNEIGVLFDRPDDF